MCTGSPVDAWMEKIQKTGLASRVRTPTALGTRTRWRSVGLPTAFEDDNPLTCAPGQRSIRQRRRSEASLLTSHRSPPREPSPPHSQPRIAPHHSLPVSTSSPSTPMSAYLMYG